MNKCKKIITAALAATMLLSLGACGSKAATSSADVSASPSAGASAASEKIDMTNVKTVTDGKLIMSTNAKFPPYEMVADNGSFEGIDVEIAQKIADKLGLELVVDDMGFDAALQAAQQGKSDMVMAGVTVSDERKAVMDFSDSYANGVQVVIVKNGSAIKTIDDLKGKMIGTQKGTTGYIYCSDTEKNDGFGEDHVTAYDDGASAIQALVNGQVDAVVIDNAPAKEYVKANAGLTILSTEYKNEDYAIGVKKGNTALLTAVNAALKELIADGTVKSIVDKYIATK